MKDINIKIRFDDENGKIGFAIDRSKDIFDDIIMTQRTIAALELLKRREMDRIEKTKTFKTDYPSNNNDEYKFWG